MKTEADSTVRKDTVKAPIGVMAAVRVSEIGPEYRWTGNQIFATGAITLADLLARIPGISILRSGGMLSPQIASSMGATGRVKIYLDGVQLDNLDQRDATLDLAWIPLWSLEEVSVDRVAGEVRVNLRSLTVRSTTPYTRTDVYTGDEDTNLYRGFYGKRFSPGHLVQFGAEQSNTSSVRGGSGDKLSVMSRLGTSNKRWSLDVFANRTHGRRDIQKSPVDSIPIPEYDATTTTAYLRFVAGNAMNGPWAAAIVSHLGFTESGPRADSVRALANRIPRDTVDTARSERQVLLRAGLTRARWRATIEDRVRNVDAKTYHDFTGGAQVSLGFLTAGGSLKRSEFEASRVEGWARYQPLSFLALNASAARNSAPSNSSPSYSGSSPETRFLQAEAGVRLFGPWLSLGILTQDTLVTGAPTVFQQGFSGSTSGEGKATYATLRGSFLRDFSFDAFALQWDKEAFYRPRTQVRTELRYLSKWLSRFPKGEFELNTAVTHTYNSRTYFRRSATASSIDPAQHLDFLLEIKILRGVASYQLRNVTGYAYENLPGFIAQRALNIYGIRWEFWN